MSLGHGHSNNSGASRFEEKTDRPNDMAVAFSYVEVVTYRDERPLYVVQVLIQRLIDGSEMLAQSFKHNSTSFLLSIWMKSSDGYGHLLMHLMLAPTRGRIQCPYERPSGAAR